MSVIKKFHIGFILLATVLLSACQPAVTTGPEMEGAWIRAVPPGRHMTAGFGNLSNPESGTITIQSFSSPSFSNVNLHLTELKDGVSSMRKVSELPLAPGETVALEPGGYHLMLTRPTEDVLVGQIVIVEMTAADGRVFQFDMPVEQR